MDKYKNKPKAGQLSPVFIYTRNSQCGHWEKKEDMENYSLMKQKKTEKIESILFFEMKNMATAV